MGRFFKASMTGSRRVSLAARLLTVTQKALISHKLAGGESSIRGLASLWPIASDRSWALTPVG